MALKKKTSDIRREKRCQQTPSSRKEKESMLWVIGWLAREMSSAKCANMDAVIHTPICREWAEDVNKPAVTSCRWSQH